MDPISSLSLASNIIQLVEFSSKVVIGAKDIYRDEAKHENAELKDVTESLLRYTSALKTSPTADIYDTELNEIADKAAKVATELVTILNSLEVPKDVEHRRWKVMHVTVKSMYKRDSVRCLECQLQSLQGHLNMWMIRSTKDDTSAVSKQVANLVDKHGELGAEMKRSIEDMKRTLGDIQRTITENQTTTHNDTDLSGRGPVRPENASAGLFGIVKRFLSSEPPATTKTANKEEIQRVREAHMKEDMRFWPEIYDQLSVISDEAKLVIKSQQLLRSLYDPDLIRRYITVEQEYPESFRWIFDNPQHGFKEWLESGQGTYWISGKPGAGKTTLMKFICEHEETEELLRTWSPAQDCFIVKHFFWISGTELQRSLEGLLRSLLFQILRRWPDLVSSVRTERFRGDEFALQDLWSIQELSMCLTRLVETLPSESMICLFVDGLDEHEGNHNEVIDLLESLVSSHKIKLCVSSRLWNVFQKSYVPRTEQLCVEDLTREDLRLYAEGRLSKDKFLGPILETEMSSGRIGKTVVEHLLDHAEGVFLWVKLVVSLLLKDAINEPTMAELHRLVDDYPKEIDPLFERILQSINKSPHAQDAAQIFSLCLNRSIIPITLAKIMFLETERQAPNYASARPVRDFTEVERRELAKTYFRLKGRCMDFLEVRGMEKLEGGSGIIPSGYEQVEFSHRTAGDFLRNRKASLQATAGTDFNVRRSSCRASLASIKSLSADTSRDPTLKLLGYEHKVIMMEACISEEITGNSLLEELVGFREFFKRHGVSQLAICKASPTGLPDESTLEDLDFTFLALTIRCGPRGYLQRALRNNPDLPHRSASQQPLLDICLRIESMPWLRTTMYRVAFKSALMLLNHGANPNQRVERKNGLSVWICFLREFYYIGIDWDNEELVDAGKTIESLLDHGADQFAIVLEEYENGGKCLTIDEVLHNFFPPDDAVFQKLAEKRSQVNKWKRFRRRIRRH